MISDIDTMNRRLSRDPAGPMVQFRQELLEMYKPPLRALATYRAMTHVLDLLEALGVQTTADLTMPLICRFVAGRPAEQSPRTTLQLLRGIRVAVGIAMGAGTRPIAVRGQAGRIVGPLRSADGQEASQPGRDQGSTRPDEGRGRIPRMARLEGEKALAADRHRCIRGPSCCRAAPPARRGCGPGRPVDHDPLAGKPSDQDHGQRGRGTRPRGTGDDPRGPDPTHRMDGPPGTPSPSECPWLIPGARRNSPGWADRPVTSPWNSSRRPPCGPGWRR